MVAIQDGIQGISIFKYTKYIRDRYQITGMHILVAIQDGIQGISIFKYTKYIRDRYQITGMYIFI
jgi:hypothetical protein